MPDIVHELTIEAPAERVFDAIATREGLSAWWTRDTEAESRVGAVGLFGFFNRADVFRMAVEALDRPRRVAWHCLGDHAEWKDTRLTFDLRPGPEGKGTGLRFVHANWRSAEGWMGTCSYTWAHVLSRLKRHAETGERVPYFTE